MSVCSLSSLLRTTGKLFSILFIFCNEQDGESSSRASQVLPTVRPPPPSQDLRTLVPCSLRKKKGKETVSQPPTAGTPQQQQQQQQQLNKLPVPLPEDHLRRDMRGPTCTTALKWAQNGNNQSPHSSLPLQPTPIGWCRATCSWEPIR